MSEDEAKKKKYYNSIINQKKKQKRREIIGNISCQKNNYSDLLGTFFLVLEESSLIKTIRINSWVQEIFPLWSSWMKAIWNGKQKKSAGLQVNIALAE